MPEAKEPYYQACRRAEAEEPYYQARRRQQTHTTKHAGVCQNPIPFCGHSAEVLLTTKHGVALDTQDWSNESDWARKQDGALRVRMGLLRSTMRYSLRQQEQAWRGIASIPNPVSRPSSEVLAPDRQTVERLTLACGIPEVLAPSRKAVERHWLASFLKCLCRVARRLNGTGLPFP